MRYIAAMLMSVSLMAGGAHAQTTPAAGTSRPMEAFIGTWILNLAKSTYSGVPAPKSERRTIDYMGDGLVLVTFETVDSEGKLNFGHYLNRFDGKEMPEFARASGDRVVSMLSLKQLDANTIDNHVRIGDRADATTGTWQVSQDRKTLTVTLKGTDRQGGPVVRVRVYEKQ
jgi:hypothetical protein